MRTALTVLATLPLLMLATPNLQAQAEGYTQEGKASFYADKFEGRTTASGERYSHKKATCAHLSLPFGTLVRVTNLGNNASTVVRVNDRGPFVADRIIDLSKSAAERLGFIGAGIAEVRIEAISADEAASASPITAPKTTSPTTSTPTASAAHPAVAQPSGTAAPTPAPAQPAVPATPTVSAAPSHPAAAEGEAVLYEVSVKQVEPSGYAVQIASYRDQASVIHHAAEAQQQLGTKVRIQAATLNGDRVYRLMVGSFGSRKDAERYRDKIGKQHRDCFVVGLQ
ncbi:MAG: septal ring lytic transglycosylase RlpA family protein [Bacteroidales bacterium]|nr:septal ring lytic transglycosylase RlpA family protein [Bacteroidales bacterium]